MDLPSPALLGQRQPALARNRRPTQRSAAAATRPAALHLAGSPAQALVPLRLMSTGGAGLPDFSTGRRPVLTSAILLAHVAVVWALLQAGPVRDAVRQVAPVFVQLISPPAPAPAPALPKLALPLPPSAKPPPAALVSVTAPSPVAAVLVAPTLAPEPMPAAPAPPMAAAAAPAPTAPPAAAPVAPPAPAPVAAAPRLLPSSAVQYLVAPVLVYPRLSQRQGETGRVVVRVHIGAGGGAPVSVQLSQSSGHSRLDDAAIAAVQKARFKPPMDNGQPVDGWALIPFDFDLDK